MSNKEYLSVCFHFFSFCDDIDEAFNDLDILYLPILSGLYLCWHLIN
jgi:hypothetical protein